MSRLKTLDAYGAAFVVKRDPTMDVCSTRAVVLYSHLIAGQQGRAADILARWIRPRTRSGRSSASRISAWTMMTAVRQESASQRVRCRAMMTRQPKRSARSRTDLPHWRADVPRNSTFQPE